MGPTEVLEFLENHLDEWFDIDELGKALGERKIAPRNREPSARKNLWLKKEGVRN